MICGKVFIVSLRRNQPADFCEVKKKDCLQNSKLHRQAFLTAAAAAANVIAVLVVLPVLNLSRFWWW